MMYSSSCVRLGVSSIYPLYRQWLCELLLTDMVDDTHYTSTAYRERSAGQNSTPLYRVAQKKEAVDFSSQ